MTAQPVSQLTAKKGKSWLRRFASMAQSHGLSPGDMLKAHRIVTDADRGGWHLEHHKWTDPFKATYEDQLVLAATQIKAGIVSGQGEAVRIHN